MIIDAGIRVVARYGLTKTTIDDIADEAGCSRATVYRYFGSRMGLGRAALWREVSRFLTRLDATLRATETLENLVVALYTEAAAMFRTHPALTAMLELEPALVLPILAGPESPVPQAVADYLEPYVQARAGNHPFAARHPRRFAEWVGRVGISYLVCPSPHVDFDDPASCRRFVAIQLLHVTEPLAT